MNKRLRKKYRVGEFRELGFSFSFEYKGDVDSQECESFLNTFIDDCIDANGLDCDGTIMDDGCFFLAAAANPKDTSEEQRLAVKTWLEGCDAIELKDCSELVDLWYDSF